jgi:hypothetical protein
MRVGPLSSWLNSACFFQNNFFTFNFFLAWGGGGTIIFIWFSKKKNSFKTNGISLICGEIPHEVSDWKD